MNSRQLGYAPRMSTEPTQNVTHSGGCHCGLIRFEVDAPRVLRVEECNCSMCSRLAYLHLIVPRDRFRLLSGEDHLSDYRFNTMTAVHRFCSQCGVKSFYVPRSHPDGLSVNVRCIDSGTVERLETHPFDGRRWEENIDSLPTLEEIGHRETGR